MTTYFDEVESIGYRLPSDPKEIVQTVADHYIGLNPKTPFTFRVFNRNGILQDGEGAYIIDLAEKLPASRIGQYAYAYGLVWSDNERSIDLVLRCFGPVRLFMNGQPIFRSTVIDEVKRDHESVITVTFHKGWNPLLLELRKAPNGFGCAIGAVEAKVRILNVLAPFRERSGQAGWVYSRSVDEPIFGEERLPDWQGGEGESLLEWLPERQWSADEREMTPLCRLFGTPAGKAAFAWTKLHAPAGGDGRCLLQGTTAGPLTIWVDGREVLSVDQAGDIRLELSLSYGAHDLLVKAVCAAGGTWGFALEASAAGSPCRFMQPHPVSGTDEPWFYRGLLDPDAAYDPGRIQSMHQLVAGTYWQLDLPGARIRPFYENAMLSNKWTTGGATNFGRWDYPLGVTMYGLLQAGRVLNRPDMIGYALSHIRACTELYEYSLWDKVEYGFPAVNHQLVLIKMLDNCGSFGSAMLEAYKERNDETFLAIARDIYAFIRDRLEKREDGAFYRICAGEYAENSMWADDLYMSTPFLIRYYGLTGDGEALDLAAKQFLLYKSYLFMPELGIMSHVYDFKYGMATRVPWGRGNGWSVFSLSEVLAALPENHKDRPALIRFFNELCSGYLALQGKNGLWHQVLNRPDAYEETSCTAMFVYAFCRGIRYGWLDKPEPYAEAVERAWSGLIRRSIDRHGNVHGVCSGSRYSFTPDYYMYDLRTVTNDNHGIGIILLAGCEMAKLAESKR